MNELCYIIIISILDFLILIYYRPNNIKTKPTTIYIQIYIQI